MATKQRRALTDGEREARRAGQRELVCASIEQLRTSDGWQAYLTARRRFSPYSWHNVLLILHQRPTSTRVAGFRTWLDLGYCVCKRPDGIPEGGWAIRTWARCEPSRKRMQAWRDAGADTGERPRGTYTLVTVFAQDQVQALPPPATPAMVRWGRSELGVPILSTQQLGDIADQDNLIGHWLLFGMRSREHATRGLELLDLDTDDPRLLESLTERFSRGRALYRDLHHRCEEIQFDPDPRLLELLNTTPEDEQTYALGEHQKVEGDEIAA